MTVADEPSTPPSLLARLHVPTDQEAWERFVELYAPLVLNWVTRCGVGPTDRDDVIQDVFVVLSRQMPRFSYDRARRFRGFLLRLTRNAVVDSARRREHAGLTVPLPLEVPDNSDAAGAAADGPTRSRPAYLTRFCRYLPDSPTRLSDLDFGCLAIRAGHEGWVRAQLRPQLHAGRDRQWFDVVVTRALMDAGAAAAPEGEQAVVKSGIRQLAADKEDWLFGSSSAVLERKSGRCSGSELVTVHAPAGTSDGDAVPVLAG